jgi:DNA-binding response OmpR family regulator
VAHTVLVVDDDEDLREVLAALFLELGAGGCITWGSLADIERDAARVLACTLAVLDVNLGEGQPNGVEVCAWLRSHKFSGRVVFLTGHAANDPRVIEASRQPGTQVLAKPVNLDVLEALAKGEP